MYKSPVQTTEYIARCFSNPRVQDIIMDWRVDTQLIQDIIVKHLREAGITMVKGGQQNSILDTTIYILKNSKEINKLVKNAESEENAKRYSRHADV